MGVETGFRPRKKHELVLSIEMGCADTVPFQPKTKHPVLTRPISNPQNPFSTPQMLEPRPWATTCTRRECGLAPTQTKAGRLASTTRLAGSRRSGRSDVCRVGRRLFEGGRVPPQSARDGRGLSSDGRCPAIFGPVNPSSLVRFLPVSQYLLERASGVWVLECGVLTSRQA